jgi:ADP-heptose:LPS heptosyltransferase
LVRLKSLGDILFTLPAVHQVRAAFPKDRISFLVSKEYAPLLAGFRDVESIVPLDRAKFRGFDPKAMAMEVYGLLRVFRRGRFSLAVDFQGYGETAFLTWFTRAPERWGSVYRPARKWAYTRQMRRDPGLHPAECHLELVRQGQTLPAPISNHYFLPETALAEAREFFAERGLDPARQTLFIQPFTSSPQKDWQLESYLGAARHWRGRGLQILFGGGPADRVALEPAREAGFPVAAGAPLLLSAGLVNLSTLVLGSDTGLLHLAVAMGKRVVMLLPSIAPGSCHPFQHRDWAVVPPDGKTVAGISAEAVNQACERALVEIGQPRS